MIDAECHLFQ